MTTRLGAALIVAAACAAGCDEQLADVAGPTPNLPPTLSRIHRENFLPTDSAGRAACANCHNPNGSAFRQVGLDLSSEAAYGLLVGVPSRERPELLRVAPGDPDNSYLVHKIEGLAGIVGLRMPRSGPSFLTSGQIQIIRRWIERGAPRD